MSRVRKKRRRESAMKLPGKKEELGKTQWGFEKGNDRLKKNACWRCEGRE